MMTQRAHTRIKLFVQLLQQYVYRVWYPPLIGALAALDNLILIVPTDGILISSTMLTPRRWFVLAMSVVVGSSCGALVLAYLVEYQGLPWILELFPGIDQTPYWVWTESLFDEYGLFLVFGVAATPLMQQPVIILASLSGIPLFPFGLAVFAGRLIKFLIMAYVGSHTPKLLSKMWGLRGELDDAGVKID